MKYFFFVFVLILFGVLSLYRPVYEMGMFYKSFNDFENSIGWSKDNNCNTIADEKAFSGNFSSKLGDNNAYSYIYQIDVSRLSSNEINKIDIEAKVFSIQNPKGLFVICQFQHGDNAPYIWLSKQVSNTANEWTSISENFGFNRTFDKTDKLAIYFWRKTGNEIIYIDDMKIKFY